MEHDAVSEPLDGPAAMVLSGVLHHACEIRGELGRSLIPAFFRERRVAREIEEGDRGAVASVAEG